MLYDVVDKPGDSSPAELREAYEAALREVVAATGTDEVAAESGVDVATIEALAAGESPDLTVEEAAAILATSPDYPDSEAIVFELRDHLLMGMSTGVLDVDTIASEVDLDLSGQEIQQALEGRIPMRLAELAAIHRLIAARNDR